MPTSRTSISVGPADAGKVCPAGILVAEPLLELDEIGRKLLFDHACILPIGGT
jgi:hypothetical protein